MNDVAFSADGKRVASAGADCTVKLWTPTVLAKHDSFKGHTGAVRSVQFSPAGRHLLTASDDKSVKVWSLPSKRFVATYSGHTNWVRCARWSPDATTIASISDDKTVKLWNTETRACTSTLFDHAAPVRSLAWHPDGTCMAAGAADGTVKLWDARCGSRTLLQHYSAHDGSANSIAWHPSGYYMWTGGDDGLLRVWDLRAGALLFTLHGHRAAVHATCLSADGSKFATGGEDDNIMAWSTQFINARGEPPKPVVTKPKRRSLKVSKPQHLSSSGAGEHEREVAEVQASPMVTLAPAGQLLPTTAAAGAPTRSSVVVTPPSLPAAVAPASSAASNASATLASQALHAPPAASPAPHASRFEEAVLSQLADISAAVATLNHRVSALESSVFMPGNSRISDQPVAALPTEDLESLDGEVVHELPLPQPVVHIDLQ